MKVNCKKGELADALAAICRVAPSRSSIPILSGCLIFTDENSLVLQSTDLEVSLTMRIPVQVEEDGCIVVTARYLYDLVRRMPVEELFLFWDEESRLLKVSYGTSVSRLHTWPAEDFPPVPMRAQGQGCSFPGGMWKKYLNKVLFVAAQQDTGFNYSGVYFQFFGDELRLAATDSYRLALLKIINSSLISGTNLYVPGRALGEVVKLVADGDSLDVSWDDKSISFAGSGFLLSTRLINSNFPDYERVIPSNPELKINMNRRLLLDTLERAALFTSPREHYAIACLKVEGDILTVSAQAAEVGSLKEDLPLDEPALKTCEASFNASYLLSPLQVMEKEKITLCLNGESGPAVYLEDGDDDSYLHLVSPVCRVG